jgi:hypothetical protein
MEPPLKLFCSFVNSYEDSLKYQWASVFFLQGNQSRNEAGITFGSWTETENKQSSVEKA